MSQIRVAFIGLGVMGYPMAGHCQKAGFPVTVYNRTTVKAEQWSQEFGGDFAATPREAAEQADFVLVCVGNDEDVRSVMMGDDGVLAGIGQGSIVIDHTTTSAELARELNEAAHAAGAEFLDAPVSGGQAGAENGQLAIMAGGEASAFARAEPVFAAYGKAWDLLGPAGSGQQCKMVNQICIAGILQGLSEGLALAMSSGLDVEKVQKILSGGAAQSWQLENRAHTMARDEYDFGFAIDWMVKDLGYSLEEAERRGLTLPVASQVRSFYQELQAQGMNRCDTSVLLRRLIK
ncbi:putative 3-hydroxyisobutyrate dehydrogenase [Reinekea sp. MED297]|uniref:Putative 3-hydroxyisobutyrate dehydrogenase n=1 Tax=Reinekea blandensis MED297 TaxID=314283 RepID=A4BHZ8_9GAMM|nr:putative 3-hydroxyisobutyrate dehydrogenase [Reinekea sp. MED297] [Reinekea blandensis MED297]